MTTLQKVKRTLADRRLLDRGDSVLVALSGGPDSVVMMHLLTRLRRSMKLTLHAVYINHQIRPRAAKKEERFCQQLCDSLKVPLTIVREDVPALVETNKLGLEEAIRALEQIGPQAVESAMGPISAVLRKDRNAREAAIKALGTVTPAKANAAIRLIARYTKDRDENVRKAAEEAIAKLKMLTGN